MSLLAIGLGALSVGVVGGLGYWMVQANNKMIRLLDMQTLLRESQATHFHHLNIATEGVLSDLNTLQTTLDALRATTPTSTHPWPYTSSCWPTKRNLRLPSIFNKPVKSSVGGSTPTD